MTVNELDKLIVAQMPELDKDIWNEKLNDITAWVEETGNDYYMLLSHDINYFTLFQRGCNDELLADILDEILDSYYSPICSAGRTEDNAAYEIWVGQTEDHEPFVFYLFPYDLGVVHCH